MTDTKQGDSRAYPAVVVIEMQDEKAITPRLTRDRYIAESMGAALDSFAPDPAPGTRFIVEYGGRAKDVR